MRYFIVVISIFFITSAVQANQVCMPGQIPDETGNCVDADCPDGYHPDPTNMWDRVCIKDGTENS